MRRSVILMLLLAGSLCCAGPATAATYFDTVMGDGPMAYWRLGDSGNPAVDETTPAYDGTYTNVGLPAPGALPTDADTAAGFGGSGGNRVSVPHNGAFNTALNGSFTWEGWVFDAADPPDNSTNWSIFYKADTASFTDNSVWFYRTRQDGEYLFTVQGTGAGERNRVTFANPGGTDAAGDKQWHHYAVVFDRTGGTAYGYKDGIQVDSSPLVAQAPVTNTGDVLLGVHYSLGSEWKGRMDEVAIYPSALSGQDIQAHYQAAVGGQPTDQYVTDGLEVYYDARDFGINGIGREGSWLDRSGNGNDATLSDAAYFANESPAPPLFGGVAQDVLIMDPNPDASGQVGSAVGTQGIDLPGGVTVEALFRLPRKDPGAGLQLQTIVNATGAGTPGSGDRKYTLQARDGDEGNVLMFHVRGDDHNWKSIESNGAHPDDEWIHVMGVFDENNDNLIKMYVNGMLQANNLTWAGGINPAEGIPVVGDPHEGTMEGAVAFARIYSRGLTLDEVLLNYANARNYFTPEPATLLIWSLLAVFGAAVGWRRRARSPR